jgi:hypothetical protein
MVLTGLITCQDYKHVEAIDSNGGTIVMILYDR